VSFPRRRESRHTRWTPASAGVTVAGSNTFTDPKDRSATVTLGDFVIPNDELIPPEVRQKITKWSDYVDYWAVDWDFRDDTFVNGWTSYRTRRDRTLQLRSEPHAYPAAGAYRVLVKAIDIFGNDTSQAYEVKVA